MQDPDLVQRAERAANALERAWDRWRTMHGHGAHPLPPVSSYVGYSMEEPWGQPRVVFGIRADEAELLAALLDGHDCGGPVRTGLAARAEWDRPATGAGRPAGDVLGVPAQAPPPEDLPSGPILPRQDGDPGPPGVATSAGAEAALPPQLDNAEAEADGEPGEPESQADEPEVVAFRRRQEAAEAQPSPGPGYRGPRYQGRPPRYEPEDEQQDYAAPPVPEPEPRAKRASRSGYVSKLNRGQRKSSGERSASNKVM